MSSTKKSTPSNNAGSNAIKKANLDAQKHRPLRRPPLCRNCNKPIRTLSEMQKVMEGTGGKKRMIEIHAGQCPQD